MPERDAEMIREGEGLFMDWIDSLSVKDRLFVTEFLTFDLSHERSIVNDVREDAIECLAAGQV
jgi:hypothetical protein